jgi:hypothetical protein
MFEFELSPNAIIRLQIVFVVAIGLFALIYCFKEMLRASIRIVFAPTCIGCKRSTTRRYKGVYLCGKCWFDPEMRLKAEQWAEKRNLRQMLKENVLVKIGAKLCQK